MDSPGARPIETTAEAGAPAEIKVVSPPAVKDAAWPRSDIDRFILGALQARGLHSAKPAGKRT